MSSGSLPKQVEQELSADLKDLQTHFGTSDGLFNILKQVIKYLLQGFAVAVAAFYIPQKKMKLEEIAMISLTAAATFAILDLWAPVVASGARQGAGFGIGANLVGFPSV